MKQIVRKGTVKGSVLFTVVTVMLVMVTFLMTTLVLTTSAKRRAHYSYYETQAQYAAQAALNSITARAYTDPDFHTYLLNTVTAHNVQHEMTVDFRGTEIQFTNLDPTTNTGRVTCWVERVDDQNIWDDVTHAIHSQPAWKITATANVGRGRNESEYTLCKTVYEKFQANPDSAGAPAMNSVNNRVWNYTQTLANPGGGGTPINLSTSPGLLSLSNQGVGNNGIWLGPQYSNLKSRPYGRTHYGECGDEYKLEPENDNYGTGNLIYVNNLYVDVMDSIMFQHKKEGAVIYGDVEVNDANRANKGIHFNSDIGVDPPTSFKECNYVYIDGTFTVTGSGGAFIGTQHQNHRGTHPVNLFCGAVNCAGELTVYGDTVLYDPALASSWSGTGENTALLDFTGSNINKNPGTTYADDVTGNLICNNDSLTLSNMTINGDLVFANPVGTLSLDNVKVKGELISAVTPSATGCEITSQSVGATAYSKINDAYYTQDATAPDSYVSRVAAIDNTTATESGKKKYDYSLMPTHLRIDEIFQNYYRWDLACDSADDCWKFINNGSGDTPDPLIDESEAAGHNWAPVRFEFEGETKWIPGTSAKWGFDIIPTHKVYNTNNVVNSLTGSSALNITSLAQFQAAAGGASNLPDKTSSLISKNKVVICGHNQSETVTKSELTLKARIVKESCTINLADINDWGSDGSLLFIDPSTSSNPLYIVLKGNVQGGNLGTNGFFIMVNNTAGYAGDDYENPTAYASMSPVTYPTSKQVYIFLDSSFKINNKFYMITSGTYAQLMANDLNIVQKPLFPSDAGFSGLDAKIKYAYELVPNYTLFGNAQTYTFGGCGFLNADIVMPKSKLHFASLNMGNQSVVYREDVDTNPWTTGGNSNEKSSGSVDGNSYLCGIGAFLVDGIDATTDKKGMFAYIGGTASPTPTPGISSSDDAEDWYGTRLGEVHVPYIDDMYESPS